MKICFFLQRRFAYIGHALAYHLRANHGVKDVCAYVGQRSSFEFLKNQTDVPYTALLLDENVYKRFRTEKLDLEYLKQLEAEYGLPNLWPYLYLDRVIMKSELIREYPFDAPSLSYEEMLRALQATAKALIAFLDREKPDVLVISVIGSMSSLLLYRIAKMKGVKTININITRIKNRVAFSLDYRTLSFANEVFAKLQAGGASRYEKEAKDWIEEFRKAPAPYMKESAPTFKNQALRRSHLSFLSPRHLIWSVPWYLKRLAADVSKKDPDHTDILTWWLVWDKLKRKVRGLIGYNDLYGTFDPTVPYAFYALHQEPETATLLYAPLYTNQLELIRQAARALPVGMKLFVKEHPAMVGYRHRAFYKEMLKIPNVKLINPVLHGYELVRGSKLVFTITGTAGWEAVLFKKPVITFGDVYYDILPAVKHFGSFTELAPLVKEQLERFTHDEKTLVHFVAALLEESVPVDYVALWVRAESEEEIMKDEGIAKMAELLAKKLIPAEKR